MADATLSDKEIARTPFAPEDLWRIVENSRTCTEQHTGLYDRLRGEYTSPFYDSPNLGANSGSDNVAVERAQGGSDSRVYSPEAGVYKLLTWIVPQLLSGRPRVKMRTRSAPDGDAALEVRMGQEAVNQWINDTRYHRIQEQLAPDPFLAWGVGHVTVDESPYKYSGPDADAAPGKWPSVRRISPRNFLFDPMALTIEDSEYLGHRWVMRRADAIQVAQDNPDEGWDLEALKGLAGESQNDDYRAPEARTYQTDRRELCFIELWYPGFELEDGNPWGVKASPGRDEGFRGTIFTIAINEGAARRTGGEHDAKQVRDPRPYFGHRHGPYYICGMHRVPDFPIPLSPTIATHGQSRDLDAIALALQKQIRTRKRMTAIETDDTDVIDKLHSGEFDSYFPVEPAGDKPIGQRIQPVETGGLDPHAVAYHELAVRWYREAIGMGEAQTGNAPTGTTATASAIASTNAGLRAKNYHRQWRQQQSDILEAVAFGIMCSGDVQIALDAEEVKRAGLEVQGDEQTWFKGGALKPDEFYRLQFELDSASMTREAEAAAAQQAMQAQTMLHQMLPQMIMYGPSFQSYFESLARALSDSADAPGLLELTTKAYEGIAGMDPNVMAAMQGQEAGPGGGPQQGGIQMPQIRLTQSSDRGNKTPGLQGVEQTTPLQGVGK